MSDDTVYLLKECDSGSKTAVNSIKEVLDNVSSEKLLEILCDSVKKHEEIGDDVHQLLSEYDEKGKDPAPVARAMSWMKINAKLLNDPSDATIAALMTDGCNMGIKQVATYKNKYPSADGKAKALAKKLISEEQHLLKELREYL